MPKDKRLSHIKVMKAAKQEFLEKGFENTSIRDIAQKAGMTSAGLYRHCKDKEDLFFQLVDPLIKELDARLEEHKQRSYKYIEHDENKALFNVNDNEIAIFIDLSDKYREEMKLLFCKSAGTRCNNYLHNFIELQQTEIEKVIEYLDENGYSTKKLSKNELHVLLSSYTTAILEPIIHDYTQEETKECLLKIQEFFTPGWMKIMGF